jgi:hypothetical protein
MNAVQIVRNYPQNASTDQLEGGGDRQVNGQRARAGKASHRDAALIGFNGGDVRRGISGGIAIDGALVGGEIDDKVSASRQWGSADGVVQLEAEPGGRVRVTG